MLQRKRSPDGFTLIELIAVISILAIFTFVAAARMVDMAPLRLEMASTKIQADIRYAQSLAINLQKRTGILFRADQNDYSVYLETSPGNWEIVPHPLTDENYTVQLGTDDFGGVSISLVFFNATNRALVFDQWGNPYSYNVGTGSAVPLFNPAGLLIISNSGGKIIRVERGTGRVYIQ